MSEVLTASVDYDLAIRRGRSQFYATVMDGTDSNVVLQLTDLKQTIDISMPKAVAIELGRRLQTYATDKEKLP